MTQDPTERDTERAQSRTDRDSLASQRQSRMESKQRRALRRDELAALSNASSSTDRREIKSQFNNIREQIGKGAIYDLSVDIPPADQGNKGSEEFRVQNDGIDSLSIDVDTTTTTSTITLQVVQDDDTAAQVSVVGEFI